MTEEQYKQYSTKKKEIAPLKDLLFWCAGREWGIKYCVRIITKQKRLLVGRVGVGAIESTEVELPSELQDQIIGLIERYVEEKERELEEI